MRSVRNVWMILIIIMGVILVRPYDCLSQEIEIDTLRGLEGVYLVVERLNPEISGKGLSKEAIQTDAELKLRLAGIRVYSRAEYLEDLRRPILYINIAGIDIRGGYVCRMRIALYQIVYLIIDSEIKAILAETWEKEMLFSTPDLEDVRDKIGNKVDQFINAYLTANPRVPAAPESPPAPSPEGQPEVSEPDTAPARPESEMPPPVPEATAPAPESQSF